LSTNSRSEESPPSLKRLHSPKLIGVRRELLTQRRKKAVIVGKRVWIPLLRRKNIIKTKASVKYASEKELRRLLGEQQGSSRK